MPCKVFCCLPLDFACLKLLFSLRADINSIFWGSGFIHVLDLMCEHDPVTFVLHSYTWDLCLKQNICCLYSFVVDFASQE